MKNNRKNLWFNGHRSIESKQRPHQWNNHHRIDGRKKNTRFFSSFIRTITITSSTRFISDLTIVFDYICTIYFLSFFRSFFSCLLLDGTLECASLTFSSIIFERNEKKPRRFISLSRIACNSINSIENG